VEIKVDVAIIGAGPAGSTLAALLAGRGTRVALIDRDSFPRDKLCGEFLSYDALPILDRLGITEELNGRGAPSIDRCVVVGRRHKYEFAFPKPARGVSRMLLDDLLLRRATAAGARSLSGWTASRIDGRKLMLDRAGESATVEAKVLVGAWGRWGRFDTQLQREFVRDHSHRSFGFKRHYRSDQPLLGAIELYSFRRGYLGVSPVEAGLTNICGLVHERRLSGLKGRWDAFVDMIRVEEAMLEQMYSGQQSAQEGFLTSEPVIFRARSTVEQGIVMVGDASGVIDPLTGNGMAMAIQSAVLAAPFVLTMLTYDNRKAVENGYKEAHAGFFARRIRWSRRVARLLSRPRLLDAALSKVRKSWAGEFLLRRTRADDDALARLVDSWFR
jgi:flavin-dependent dehydrogenase